MLGLSLKIPAIAARGQGVPVPPPGYGFLALSGRLITLNGKTLMLRHANG